MKPPHKTHHTSVRLHWIAAELLKQEKARSGGTDAEIISRALIETYGGPEADALVLQYAESDPRLRPLLATLRRLAQAADKPGPKHADRTHPGHRTQ